MLDNKKYAICLENHIHILKFLALAGLLTHIKRIAKGVDCYFVPKGYKLLVRLLKQLSHMISKPDSCNLSTTVYGSIHDM